MDSIDVLLEYFSIFKEIELASSNEKSTIKNLNEYIEILENIKNRTSKVRYIVDYNLVKELAEKFDASTIINNLKNKYSFEDEKNIDESVPNYIKDIVNNVLKGKDNIIYDIILNVNKCNNYLKNKKNKSIDLPISTDITFDELDVGLKEVLSYLEVNEEEIDKKLLFDLKKFADINKLKEFAILLKTDMNYNSVIYDKITDKNQLLSILLHSNIENIRIIYNALQNKNAYISKLTPHNSNIFIKDRVSSKCKYQVPCNYDNLIKNGELIEKYNCDLKKFINFQPFLIKNYNKNLELVNRLEENNVNVKNVLEYVAGKFSLNPDVIFKNIDILPFYGIKLTNDENNNGYTILGMDDLEMRLDYFIESKEWQKNNDKLLDNIDLIRGLIFKDDYLKWKNNYNYVKLESNSEKDEFTNDSFNKDKLNQLFEKQPDIKDVIDRIDNVYWNKDEVYYSIGLNRISRNRLLRNLCNYTGKDKGIDMLIKSLNYNSNISNSDEVINALKQTLEMGDEGVKLSKGL